MFTLHRPHYPSTFGFQGLLIPTSTLFQVDTKVCCWRLTPDSWSFSLPFHVAAGTNGLAPPFWSQLAWRVAATLVATLPLCSFESLPVTLQWALRTTQSPGEASLTPLLVTPRPVSPPSPGAPTISCALHTHTLNSVTDEVRMAVVQSKSPLCCEIPRAPSFPELFSLLTPDVSHCFCLRSDWSISWHCRCQFPKPALQVSASSHELLWRTL